MKRSIIIITYIISIQFSFGQLNTNNFDTSSFKLDKKIKQNGSEFLFWKNKKENKLIIQRKTKNKDSIICPDFSLNTYGYQLRDVNFDGLKDLVTIHHFYDKIYFFIKSKNDFAEEEKAFCMPQEIAIIDTTRKLICGFREALYADDYPYSIIYKYKDTTAYFYFKLVFITNGKQENLSNIKKIKLYKYKNGDSLKPIFIKDIQFDKTREFDFLKYWQLNYMKLLGYS